MKSSGSLEDTTSKEKKLCTCPKLVVAFQLDTKLFIFIFFPFLPIIPETIKY